MKINENNSLKEIENGLRKIISFSMELKYGKNWIDNLKIGKEKIEEWKSKKEEERKRFRNNISENRLLYYSNFYDLKNIIDKHWNECFCDIFKNKQEFDVLFEIVAGFRTNIAHNRTLYKNQKLLLKGIL